MLKSPKNTQKFVIRLLLRREEKNVNKSCVYVKEREERETEAYFFFIQNGLGIKCYV